MWLTQFSINHNVAVILLCVGIVGIGAFCYFDMPRESFPDVEFPYIIVTTVLDGANPTDIEESVTIPLETELDGTEGLKEMRSLSSDSMSMISLEFHPEVDTEIALNRVRDRVDQGQADISPDAEEPVVKEFSLSSLPVLIYHLVGSGAVASSDLKELADKLEDELKLIPGVLEVEIFGGREREVVVEVDPDRLRFYNLPMAQVRAIVEMTNRNVSAGTAESDANRVVMRVPGEFQDAGEIMGLVVGSTQDGIPIYLRDLATVRYDFEDEKTKARFYNFIGSGGDPVGVHVDPRTSVSLHIKKRAGANIIQLCDDVEEVFRRQPLPEDVEAVKGLDESKQVREMIGDLENGIGTSLILVLLVIFVGLGARNALLVAAAVPFSMLLSMVILKLWGDTLNMMVLFSLILALGMLVDNAIVIVENIYRHFSMGASRAKAAVRGTAEVAWPVITSTATTVGAFLPMAFWPGIMGKFMSYLPRTVIIVLLSSLFVALVINPALAAMVMRLKTGARTTVDPESRRPRYWLVLRYQRLLEFLLDRPAWTLSTSLVMLVLILATYGAFGAGVEFFPPVDPENATCSIKPPEGVSLKKSDQLSRQAEDRIFGMPGSGYDRPVANLKYAGVVVGLEDGTGGGFGQENAGPIRTRVEFVDRKDRTERSRDTLTEMRRRLSGLDREGNRVTFPLFGADFDVIKPQEGPPTGMPVSIDIFGEDLNQMNAVLRDMKQIMMKIPGTVKPTDDAATAQPTLEWKIDRARAGIVGLDQATIGSTLQMAVGGLKVGTLGHGEDEQDILLRFPEKYRLDTTRLKNVTVPVTTGGDVPVTSVATPTLVPGPVTIKHYNTRRVLNAGADVQPGVRNDADIRANFQDQAAAYAFPPGVTYRFGGAAEEQQKATEFLSQAFVIAIFTILMVMVLQFNSIAVSGMVMCSVILSLMGVFTGLLVLQAPFGIIMTGIGVISLAGIVVNNAIVLLYAVRQFESRGLSVREAVVTASMVRFRPVLLTAVTTMLGLLPMAVKLNFDFRAFAFQYDTTSSQWWQSMATAVIFGLLVATVLTLGVVPALYVARHKIRKWWRGAAAPPSEPAAAP